MCGIAGHLKKETIVDSVLRVKSALEMIRYRGPDDLHIEQFGNFCGGSVRLAIEAVEAGKQPIQSDNYIIGFNGELFNYKALAKKYGLTIEEVNSEVCFLLHAWMKIGPKLFSDLEGQFSIFIYNKLKKELLLARDPYGI